jgi:hypothetical protein
MSIKRVVFAPGTTKEEKVATAFDESGTPPVHLVGSPQLPLPPKFHTDMVVSSLYIHSLAIKPSGGNDANAPMPDNAGGEAEYNINS